ncbi:hypothetical protein N7453_007516 [Penicillium expansum]|nr:hypothetical protein N7453_007516 [Penicillium expansum]
MKKECLPSPPVRKRRMATKISGDNKVERLEEKVDGLVALLKSVTQDAPSSFNASGINSVLGSLIQASSSSEADGVIADNSQHVEYPYDRSGVNGRMEGPFTPTASSSSRLKSTNQLPFLIHPYLEPSAEEAAAYLVRFRNEFQGHLPFLQVSSSMTAQQLRQESPLLWLSIMTVASTRSTQQIMLSKEVRGVFGREAYIEGTRNMDFLLAVLVYTTWDRHYCLDRSISTSLVQLAIAILYDLGLDKPPPQDPGVTLAYVLKGCKLSQFTRSPTSEERRALLGCFLISTVPTSWGKGQSLQWTAYFDECVHVLEEQKELASDLLLVQLVNLRSLSENVSDHPGLSAASGIHTMRPQATVYLKSLEARMRNLKSNIPQELNRNRVLLLEIYNTELMIHTIALSPGVNTFPGQPNQRFECIYACLQAVKSWLDTFSMIQPVEFVGFSSLMYANMMRCFIGIYRLATCNHPEWDRTLLHEAVNVSRAFEEASNSFDRVKEVAGLDPDGSQAQDSFSVMASKLRSMKMSWDAMPTLLPPPSIDELENFTSEFLDTWNW